MPRLVLNRRRIRYTSHFIICNVKTNYYSSRSYFPVCNTLGSKAFYSAKASKSCRTLEDILPANKKGEINNYEFFKYIYMHVRKLDNSTANFLMLLPRLDIDDFQRKSPPESLSYIPLNDIKIININASVPQLLCIYRVLKKGVKYFKRI